MRSQSDCSCAAYPVLCQRHEFVDPFLVCEDKPKNAAAVIDLNARCRQKWHTFRHDSTCSMRY
jgi:hypothetical protein